MICQIDRQIIIGPKHELTQSIEMGSLKKHVKVMKNFFVCQFADLQITKKCRTVKSIHLKHIFFSICGFQKLCECQIPFAKVDFPHDPLAAESSFSGLTPDGPAGSKV